MLLVLRIAIGGPEHGWQCRAVSDATVASDHSAGVVTCAIGAHKATRQPFSGEVSSFGSQPVSINIRQANESIESEL